MEEEDEFDAIFQDGSGSGSNGEAGGGDVKAKSVNYKVSMEQYQKVDIFQSPSDTSTSPTNQESPDRKYRVASSERTSQEQVHQGHTNSANTNNHGNNLVLQSRTSSEINHNSEANPSKVTTLNSHSENGTVGDRYQVNRLPVRGRDKEDEAENDPNHVLRAEVPRDRAGTGGDPEEQFVRAKAEWDAVGTIQPGDDSSEEGNDSTINVTPLVSFNETLAFFQRSDMQPYLAKIKPRVQRSGFAAFRHLILGPPDVKPSLHEERDLVFAIAQCPFDDREETHRRVLQTIYKQLTGSTLDCPRYGDHWEQIGFQGNDPSTDLRACGFLGLMTLLHLVMDPVRLQLAKDIYRLSLHETQNFPFSVMSINMTRIALQSLREGSLSRECNRRKQVFGVINDFYAGCFLQLYQIWKHQRKTIKDSGFVIKDVESMARKNPRGVIRALETYLHTRGDKQGGNISSGEAGDRPLEFAGVHELEATDDR